MMSVTWLGIMPCISKRFTKNTPYSSTVCVGCEVTRQCAASSGFCTIELVEAERRIGVADIESKQHV